MPPWANADVLSPERNDTSAPEPLPLKPTATETPPLRPLELADDCSAMAPEPTSEALPVLTEMAPELAPLPVATTTAASTPEPLNSSMAPPVAPAPARIDTEPPWAVSLWPAATDT